MNVYEIYRFADENMGFGYGSNVGYEAGESREEALETFYEKNGLTGFGFDERGCSKLRKEDVKKKWQELIRETNELKEAWIRTKRPIL